MASREPGRDRELWFPRPVFAEMRRIVRALETEDKVMVSDRKLVKLYKVIRTQAFLNHGGAVQHADLGLLAYVGNRRDELPVVPVGAMVREGVSRRPGPRARAPPGR